MLAALGIDRSLAAGSLRLSLGWSTTQADVDAAVDAVPGGRRPPPGPRPRRGAGMTERVLVAMSGGVDSSVAAALLLEAGHDVVGRHAQALGRRVRLRLLLGGRRRRRPLGGPPPRHRAPHLHLRRRLRRARGGALRRRPRRGPHAEPVHRVQPPPQVRPAPPPGRRPRLRRRRHRPPRPDRRARRRLPARGPRRRPRQGPVVRRPHARPADPRPHPLPGRPPHQGRGARRRPPGWVSATADKPDSQDVCFITATGGRTAFLEPRLETHPGTVVDRRRRARRPRRAPSSWSPSASATASASRAAPSRATSSASTSRRATVTVGDRDDLLTDHVELERLDWVDRPRRRPARSRRPAPTARRARAASTATTVRFDEPTRRVAPGQTVVLYDGDEVVAGGIARY